jgi:di/tricarboxylate transporter
LSAAQILSIALLLVVLLVAIWRRMNIGVLALAAALPVLAVSGLNPTAMYTTFPGNIFVLIAGVSLLFAHLERSGALAYGVEKIYAAVGDREALLPWAGFVIAGALSTAGAFSTAPIAFLVPMVAHLGERYRSSFLLCELAVVIGANSAGLSPLNPTGAVVRAVADKFHVHYAGWGLWAVSVVVAILVVIALQLLLAMRARRGRPVVVWPAAPLAQSPEGQHHRKAYAWCSGLSLIFFVVLVVVPKTDVGVTAMCLAALLQIVFNPKEYALLARIPWNSVLLLCGLLTYLGLMEKIGTMDSIAQDLRHLGAGALLIFVLAYTTAFLCNIESSTLGVLGLMMPLAFTAFGGSAGVFWIIAAICVPSALMVMNPIHVAGTLIIGNSAVDHQELLFRRLLGLALSLAVIVPGIMAGLAIVAA